MPVLTSRWLLRQLCWRRPEPPRYDDARFQDRFVNYDVESTRRFFARFGSCVDVSGCSVLDVGCGRGATAIEAARRGARHVVGIDLRIAPQTRELASDRTFGGRVEFLTTDGTLAELGAQRFDVILSKDSFEHYATPELLIHRLVELLAPNGVLAIGFGPLWKSPQGGHLEFMTPVPWVHLVFAEECVLAERARFRPEEPARSFAEIRGGLNKMTLARFQDILGASGLECIFFQTNVSDHFAVRLMSVLRRFAPLEELFTTNVYGVWQRTPTAETSEVRRQMSDVRDVNTSTR